MSNYSNVRVVCVFVYLCCAVCECECVYIVIQLDIPSFVRLSPIMSTATAINCHIHRSNDIHPANRQIHC